MIQELHMASVTTTIDDWWYDSGATTHVCNNKDLFKTYKKTKDEHEVMMGDNHTSKNGVAERKNRVLQYMINAMLVSANFLKNLWGEALLTTRHVSNRITAKKLKVSPYEIWKGRKPNISYFGVCGCLAYYKVPLPHTSKLVPRGLKSVFVGYTKHSKSYRCLDLDSNVIVESRDVDFIKNKFRHDLTSTNKSVTQILQDISSLNLSSNNKRNMGESSGAPRRSERARKERKLDHDFIDSQAKIFFVEGDNENNVINEIPVLLNMKDMNEVDTILWIKIKRHSEGYELNQCHYTDKIIDKFQHLDIKEANTPYKSSCKLVKNDGHVVAQIEYASAIGCLMYATHYTRPDIGYVVCKLSRYTSNPSQDHYKAIRKVLGYLKRIRQLALYYDHFSVVLKGYSDASWITGSSDSNYKAGWIFTLGGGAVSEGSKKQTCITHSIMEAEFLAIAAAVKEVEWLRNMLLDIEFWPQPMPAVLLHCDSQ
nr:zinc finger, CCHC-type [Tanacetum cinerariifolium]